MPKQGWVLGIGLAALAAWGLSLSGCGAAECADGTVEQDGECVLEVQCGEGEVRKDGECVDEVVCGPNAEFDGAQCVAEEPTTCGDDTERDPNTNECMPTEEVCGDNTAFSADENRCVLVSEVCDDGTFYDDETGLCYPDAQCRPGDVISDDGLCVSAGEDLVGDAQYEATGNTNPDLGGTPVAMDIDDDEPAIFQGVIGEPSDLNDDGDVDQHVDYFSFEAEVGDRFQISLYSLGLPDPVFYIVADDDADEDYERFGPRGVGNDKQRQIIVPADGTYYIGVAPGAMPLHLIGDDDWGYVGSVERLDAVDAVEHEFSEAPFDGTLGDYEGNFIFSDEYDAGDNLAMFLTDTPASAEPVIQHWIDAGEFEDEFTGDPDFIEIPESGELYLVGDWIRRMGQRDLDYQIDLMEVSDLESGDDMQVEVTAEDGDMLRASWIENGITSFDAHVEITNEDGDIIREESVGQDEPIVVFDLEAGDYTVTFSNDTQFTTFTLFTPSVDVISPQQADPVDADENEYLTLQQVNSDDAPIYAQVTDESGVVIIDDMLSTTDVAGHYVGDNSGEYTVTYFNLNGASNLDVDLQALPPQTAVEYSAQTNDLIAIEQQNEGEQDVFLSVTNDDSGEIVFADYVDPSETIELISATDDDFTVSYFEAVSGLDVTVEINTPTSAETFTGSAGGIATIEQDNNGDQHVEVLVVHDDTDQVAVRETVSTQQQLDVELPKGGDYTVYYYDFDALGGLVVDVDTLDPVELETFTVDSGATADVAEISHDQSDELDIAIINDDDDRLITSEQFDDSIEYAFNVVGLAPADYSVVYRDHDDLGLVDGDVDVTVDVVAPEVVDFDASYSGDDINENIYGQHDYYLVDLDEDATYDINLDQVGQTGWARIMIYEPDHELVYTSQYTSSGVETVTWEFDSDRTYILRIGGDSESHDWPFDYQLTFDEL